MNVTQPLPDPIAPKYFESRRIAAMLLASPNNRITRSQAREGCRATGSQRESVWRRHKLAAKYAPSPSRGQRSREKVRAAIGVLEKAGAAYREGEMVIGIPAELSAFLLSTQMGES